MTSERYSEYPIEALFLNRWPPRAFGATSMPASDLCSIPEAARWAQLALQATLPGYHTHARAGFHYDRIREDVAVPEQYHVKIAVVFGRREYPSVLAERLRGGEKPSLRLTLGEIAFAGSFPS